MAKIFTEDEFFGIYESRLEIYASALYYDSGKREYERHQTYWSAVHSLQRYLVQRHISQGFTEVMADKMYNYSTGGPLKPPSGYEYINPTRYPELDRLYKEAEEAREKYNVIIWNKLVNYRDRIYELKKFLKFNSLKPEYIDDVKKFVAMDDRIEEIKQNEYWGRAANTKRYEQEEERKKKKYEDDFARAHPGFAQEKDDAWHEGHYAWQKGNNIRKVEEKYGFKDYENEQTIITRAAKIYRTVMEDREKNIYDTQKSLNNLYNYSRAIIRALKSAYPSFTDEDCADFWKRHFDRELYLGPAPKAEPAVTSAPVSAPNPRIVRKKSTKSEVAPTKEDIEKYCRVLNGRLTEFSGEMECVVLPDGIKEIRYDAFDKVKGKLKRLVLPGGIVWIQGHTFKNCPKLEEVVLPEGMTVIGERAFENCPKLKTVVFPSTVLNVDDRAFANCTALKSVTLPKDCFYYGSSFPENCEIKEVQEKRVAQESATGLTPTDASLFKIENKICKKYLGKEEDVVIPDGITKIGSSSFGLARPFLKSVVIPEGVKEIASLAFCDCKKLERVTLPSTLRIIKNQAFYCCSELIEITFPEGLTFIDGSAFAGCRNLRSVRFPSTLEEIAAYAFSSCDNLIEVILPKGVKLSEYAETFPSGCKVIYADKETVAQRPAKADVTSNVGFKPVAEAQNDVVKYCNISGISLTRFTGDTDYVVLPDEIKEICNFAFDDVKKSLRVVVLPEGVTKINEKTFSNCSNLEEVRLPSTLKKIGPWAFAYCGKLKSVNIPSSVINIGANAFEGCNSLSEVEVPSGCYYNKNKRTATFPLGCKVTLK